MDKHIKKSQNLMTVDLLRCILIDAFPGAQVVVHDMTGTQDHFEIDITSEIFKDKKLIAQHKMVFDVLKAELDDRIHALKIKTRCP